MSAYHGLKVAIYFVINFNTRTTMYRLMCPVGPPTDDKFEAEKNDEFSFDKTLSSTALQGGLVHVLLMAIVIFAIYCTFSRNFIVFSFYGNN